MDAFNAGEFKKKYRGSYLGVIFRGEDKVRAVHLNDVITGGTDVYHANFSWQEPKKKSMETKAFKFSDFKVVPHPDKQLVDYKGHTFLFTRRPARQWMRGVTDNNSMLSLAMMDFVQELPASMGLGVDRLRGLPRASISFDIVQDLYDPPKCLSFGQAIEALKSEEKRFSVKLSQIYFVSLTPKKGFPFVIFRNTIPLAYYNDDVDEFTIIKEIYYQEVIDFCFRNGLNSKVRKT
jgi:hypothetical protein